jgi:site-specific recombinase XerD
MLELLNIRFSFLCRTTHKNNEGKQPIVFRITFRGERRDLFTGLYCEKEEWNNKVGRLHRVNKLSSATNDNLDLIQRKAFEQFDGLRQKGELFSIDELVDHIKARGGERPQLLMDYLETEKNKLKNRLRVDITPATYDKYRRSASHLQLFLQTEYKAKNFSLNRIDTNFLEKYFQYLRHTRSIAHNTAVKYITFLKTILMPAIKSGMIKDDPFREMKLRLKPVYKGYLTQEEIDMLMNVELKSSDLDRIRNIFLFSCFTGLAYSDILQLNRQHILMENDGSFFIRKPRQKTGVDSIIPLLPVSMRILQKYSITKDFRDFIWKVSSNQKMNQRLKVIGKAAGVDKELHMHLARHTFATTVTLSNGVPIESVSSMLGHASLKQTQHYAKIISQKLKGDMAKISGLFQ